MKANRFIKSNKKNKLKFKPSKKEWKNPLFNNSKKKIWSKLNKIFISLIVLVLGYFIIYSSLFSINNIKFEGERYDTTLIKQAVTDQMSGNKLLIVPEDNILFFSKKNLVNAFKDHPYLKNISIHKRWFHTLIIKYELRKPELVIFNQNIYWTIDRAGYVLSALDKIDNFAGPKIYDRYNDYQVTSKVNYADRLNDFYILWNDLTNKYKIKEIYPIQINILQNKNNYELITNKGWKIIFTTDYDISKQLKVLSELINDKIEDVDQLNYIDLRIENWIYYK